ncbi:CATRA system-associated protein [Actinoplanes flavus]|uniref:CATRA-Associated Small Protein domain-containing protein n=1 Tax=Actinoplanes flavus TaxID=2820290 RepID=A0ABS3ULZ1_9ACTN|nr:CATRA system-associated protein [Actinoplanes flavus]MBO3738677.1 hypothetical protein [Actinoplanes flavus]
MSSLDLPRLLDDTVRWTHTAEGWRRIDDALRLLDGALATGDTARMRQGTTALMLAAPTRAGRGVHTSMGQPPRHPVPQPTRDLVNRLLHRLGRPTAPEDDGDDETA